MFSWAIGRISLGHKNEFELTMVNEPSVFEPLRFDCICTTCRYQSPNLPGCMKSSFCLFGLRRRFLLWRKSFAIICIGLESLIMSVQPRVRLRSDVCNGWRNASQCSHSSLFRNENDMLGIITERWLKYYTLLLFHYTLWHFFLSLVNQFRETKLVLAHYVLPNLKGL